VIDHRLDAAGERQRLVEDLDAGGLGERGDDVLALQLLDRAAPRAEADLLPGICLARAERKRRGGAEGSCAPEEATAAQCHAVEKAKLVLIRNRHKNSSACLYFEHAYNLDFC